MADEDTRSSGGGLPQEDDKFPSSETEVEGCGASPSGASAPQLQQEQDQGAQNQQGRPSSPGSAPGRTPLLDIHKGRPIRLQVRVLVPIKDHPNYNFVGKLLGPKGNSLKRLQEESQTKMAILGRGSMRDRAKEEELRATGDPKHGHLRDDLHVEITAFAPAAEAYARMAHALAEVKRFLVPDYYDEIRQNQLRELAVLNGNRKRGHKAGTPEGAAGDFDGADGVAPPPQQAFAQQPPPQQRIQVPVNGSSPHPGQAVRSLRCGLVTRGGAGATLVGRAARAAPPRPGGVVRSFVCGGAAPALFREVTLASTAPGGTEPARIKYLAQEDAFTFEEGFVDPQRPDEFSIRSSQAYIGPDYRDDDEDSDAVYETHNGYTAKDFIGEDWPKGSASASPPMVSPLRVGPTTGRLKASVASSAPLRPPRSIYREHPYFPAAVARY